MPRVRPRVAVALALAAFTASPVAADDPGDLLKYIPTPVNTIAVVNVAGILRSPRAVKEGWANLPNTEYLAGAVPINSSVDRILLATEFEPGHPAYSEGMAVAPLKSAVNLDKLGKAQGGKIVSAGGEKVLETTDGRFFVPLAPQLLGAIRSDSRQDVTRWLRYAKTAEKSQQSQYLNRSVFNFGTRFHILVAVDTEDLFSPDQLRTAVAESKVVFADRKTADAVTAFIAGMTGVRFSADIVENGIAATIRIDSNLPAATVPPDIVKGFVIETLAKNGAALADLNAASARSEAGTVILSFNVTDGELAKIMSLFVTAASGLSDTETIPVAPAGVTPAGTRTYFRAVDRVLNDLMSRNETGAKYDTAAVWYDTAANQVATLSVLNADPVAVKFGQATAGRLQAMAASLRGVPLKAQELDSKAYIYEYRTGGWGWWGGGGGVSTNIPRINQQIREAGEKDKENRAKLWEQINADRAAARQQLAEKYSTDFGRP